MPPLLKLLKLLKMGRETSSLHQMKAQSKLIWKMHIQMPPEALEISYVA